MADDEDKTKVESPEEGKGDQPPAKDKSKMLMFIIIGVVVLGLGVGGGIFLSGSSSSSDGEEMAEETTHESEKKSSSHSSKPKKKKKARSGHGESGDGSGSIVYAIKDIVVNPAGTAGSRFLSVSFGFELASAELETAFEDREPLIRDALITILSSKTVSQLTDAKQKEIMRYQVRRRLSKLLKTDGLEGVYFTDFVLQ